MTASALALLGVATVGLAAALWIRGMRRLRLPEDPRGFGAAMAAGALLGAAALVAGSGLLPRLLGALALLGGGGFLALQLGSRQAPPAPELAVGRRLPALRAAAADGGRFELASLQGRPFLLKLFRGHW